MEKDEELHYEEDSIDDFDEEFVDKESFSSSLTSPENESKSLSEGNLDDTKTVSNWSDSDSEKLKNHLPGYKKADNNKEAFKKTLNNKNYYNDKKNEIENKKEENRSNLDKNNKEKDSATKRLEEAKIKRRNTSMGNRSKEDKNELRDAKRDNKNQQVEEKRLKKEEKSLKKDSKNVAKDEKKSQRFKKMHPVQAAKMQMQDKINKIKRKIILKVLSYIAPAVLGLALCIIVIEIILGPIIESWGSIDQAITKAVDFNEKIENFYNGFGLQDSKEAFYDEIEKLNDRYGNQLNIPLLLSTIFYTEGQGYDTKFENMESSDASDPSVMGSNEGISSSIKQWLREKYDESKETVDENGLKYNVGKIYRLRKLARNQFYVNNFGLSERKGEIVNKNLKDFLFDYGKYIALDIKNLLSDITGFIFSSIDGIFGEIIAQVIDSKYQGEYFDRLKEIGGDFKENLKLLIGDIFYGIAAIEDVKIDWFEDGLLSIQVYYHSFTFDKENYDKYLNDYYIENMPEFKSMLNGLSSSARESKKKAIVNEIYENENLFRDIYLKYTDESSESYADSCIGGIDNRLVSHLELPVKIANGFNITFDGDSTFGISNGQMHNGLDINELSTGNKAGDAVYAIASGTIEEIGPQVSNSSSISNYLFIGDSRYVGIKSNLESLGSNNTVLAVTSSNPSQWEDVTSSGSGKVINTQIDLPSSVFSISVMLGVNNPSQVTSLQNVLNNLHTRYPNATIYYNSTYHIGTNYTLGYVKNSDIDKLNSSMKAWCDNTSFAKYIDITSGLNDSNGNLKSEYSSDGLHLTSNDGKNQLVNNIKSGLGGTSSENLYSNWIKISHSLDIDTHNYKFYSIYRNVDTSSVSLSKGSSIAKGDKIGTIASSSSDSHLHFEFRDDDGSSNGKPIDPTNLFIKCSNSIELVGADNEEKTWNYLVDQGFTKVAAAGMVGNFKVEGLNPTVVEYASNAHKLYGAKKFTEMVDNGSISRGEFISSSRLGVPKGWGGYNYNGLTYGYGLAQWTSPNRKAGLYDSWSGPNSGVSIGDLGVQLNFVMQELNNDYISIKENTMKATTPSAAAYAFWYYEVGANKTLRAKYAEEIYNKYTNR